MPAKAVVIGSGAAGSAIASALCRRGYDVTLLCRAPREGSSFTGLNWNHSGLFFPAEPLARRAAQAFLRESLLRNFTTRTRSSARFLALKPATLHRRQKLWESWDARSWGLDWRPLTPAECAPLPNPAGGFEVPDRVVDFPALIRYLREDVRKHGGTLIADAEATTLRLHNDRISAVALSGSRPDLPCSLCVLAAGPWSNRLLTASGLPAPSLTLHKSSVIEFDATLVPGLTSCLDAAGPGLDLTLVPFDHTTLAAGAAFTEIADPDDLAPDPLETEALRDQLLRCFPALADNPSRVLTGIKTGLTPQVWGPAFHGITGLTVALPGHAGFLFDLADRVLNEVDGLTVASLPAIN